MNNQNRIYKALKIAAAWAFIVWFIALAFYRNQASKPKPDQLQMMQDQKETVIRELRKQRIQKDQYIKLLSWTDAEIKKLTESEKKLDDQIKQRSLTGIDYVKSFQ